jgi:hypothetical protein
VSFYLQVWRYESPIKTMLSSENKAVILSDRSEAQGVEGPAVAFDLALASSWVPHPCRVFCGMGGKPQIPVGYSERKTTSSARGTLVCKPVAKVFTVRIPD